MAQSPIQIKRGEYLYKEGEIADKVFLVESGRIEIVIERNVSKIKLQELGASQIAGDAALFGLRTHTSSCIAMQNTKVMSIPIDLVRKQMEGARGILKLLIKSMTDQMKMSFSDLKSLKLEKDTSPLPQKHIPQVFGIINLISQFSGEEQEEGIKVGWGSLKNYTMKMFLEAPERVENAIKILTKLGYADMEYTTSEDPEGEENAEELSYIKIFDPQLVQDFPEFYAYHLFKPGKSEILYINKKCLDIVNVLAKNYASYEKDHKGGTNVPFETVIKDMAKVGINFKSSDLNLLAGKGIFISQKNPEKGEPILNFDYDEVSSTAQFWQILNEVDKWNKKGFVDMEEKPETPQALGETEKIHCPSCQAGLNAEQKFCHECGHNMKAAA